MLQGFEDAIDVGGETRIVNGVLVGKLEFVPGLHRFLVPVVGARPIARRVAGFWPASSDSSSRTIASALASPTGRCRVLTASASSGRRRIATHPMQSPAT